MVNDVFHSLGINPDTSSGFGRGNPFNYDVSRLEDTNLVSDLVSTGLSFIPGGNIIGNIFGGLIPGESAPTKFAKLAYEWVNKILTEMPAMYGDNLSKMLSEMDKHLSFVVSAYKTWVKTSRGGSNSNTAQGHRMGLEFAEQKLKEFRNSVNGLKSQYDIKVTNVASKKLQDSLPFMPNPYKMRADIVGGYRTYVLTPKTVESGVKVEYKTVVKDGVKTQVPVIKSNFNPLLLLLLLPFGLIVWLIVKIFKK